MEVRLAGVIKQSVVDGPGLRFVVFTQGCKHNCKGCQNPQTHDVNGGYISDTDNILAEIKKDPLLYGITLSGGEPFLQAEAMACLAKAIKDLGMNVITYTGYKIEELLSMKGNRYIKELLLHTDILVDGKFILEKKSMSLRFRGSTNQRIIDSKKSVVENKAIVLEDFIFKEDL